jgi:hypothetical protein
MVWDYHFFPGYLCGSIIFYLLFIFCTILSMLDQAEAELELGNFVYTGKGLQLSQTCTLQACLALLHY